MELQFQIIGRTGQRLKEIVSQLKSSRIGYLEITGRWYSLFFIKDSSTLTLVPNCCSQGTKLLQISSSLRID